MIWTSLEQNAASSTQRSIKPSPLVETSSFRISKQKTPPGARRSSTRSLLANTPVQNLREEELCEVEGRGGAKRKRPRQTRNLDVATPVQPFKKLRASQVKRRTLLLYTTAVEELEAWRRSRARSGSSHQRIDEDMALFIQALCEDSRHISEANYAVYGWILLKSPLHMPEQDQLPFSKQALEGWRTRFPGRSRAGVDLALWDLVACSGDSHSG